MYNLLHVSFLKGIPYIKILNSISQTIREKNEESGNACLKKLRYSLYKDRTKAKEKEVLLRR